MRGINIVLIVAVLAVVMITPVMAFEPGECDIEVHPGDSLDAKVNSATDGQTVCVYAGTYGWFTLNTPNVTLKGEGADKVTLDCGGTRSAIGNVEPHHAPGCIVDGFKFINSDMGIEVHSGSPDCIIRNCVFEGITFQYGIRLVAANVTFRDNVVTGATGAYGAVQPCGGGSHTIVNNTIIDNTGAGILLYPSTAANNTIRKNNISSNGKGFFLYNAGEGNKIYLNDVINTPNVAYGGTAPTLTYWNSTEQIEYVYGGTTYTNYLGNYWSDYTGGDTSPEDGIGDVPYVVHGTDMDHRPLMAGFENYPVPAAGICGDVNKDDAVDFIDMGLVARHWSYGDTLADAWAADVNGDDAIDFIDMGLIARHWSYGVALSCK